MEMMMLGEKKPVIEYDTRENITVEAFLGMKPAQLPVGDFRVIGKTLIVEHKAAEDWRKCLFDRTRFVNQILNMNANYEKSVVVISGCNQISYKGAQEHAIIGSLASLVIRSNTSFVPVQNAEQLAYLVGKLFEKAEDGKTLKPLIDVKKTVDHRIGILSGISGISGELAQRLLDRFQTIQNVANAEMKELMEVEGIGKGKATEIHRELCE
jgi:ERCC4-type nuclease